GEMGRPAPDAPPGVVAPELQGIGSRRNASILPPEPLHGQLIAGEVPFRIPKRPRLDDDHLQARPGANVGQHAPRGPCAHDAHVRFHVAVLAPLQIGVALPIVMVAMALRSRRHAAAPPKHPSPRMPVGNSPGEKRAPRSRCETPRRGGSSTPSPAAPPVSLTAPSEEPFATG